MQSRKRFALALVIMLSGFLLVPFVALPKESFRWQMFAGAYGAEAAIGSNYGDGSPGSYFLISGFGFTPGATLTLKVNGRVIGTVVADSQGEFRVQLSATGVGEGRYVVAVDNGAASALAAVVASTFFDVIDGAPLRGPTEGVATLTVPNVPAGLGDQKSWLPQVMK